MPRGFFVARVIFSLLAMVLVVRHVDIGAIGDRWARLDPLWLALGLALLLAATTIEGVRWWAILGSLGIHVRAGWALRANFAGYFIGQLLPGSISGDAARIWFTTKGGARLVPSSVSIIVDRLTGLSGSVVVLMLSAGRLSSIIGSQSLWIAATLALLVCIGVILLYMVDGAAVVRRWGGARFAAVAETMSGVQVTLTSRVGPISVAASTLIHLLGVGTFVCIANALGLHLPYWSMAGIVIFATMITVLPISVNGWGLREGAMIAGLKLIGVEAADALMISVLYGLIALCTSVPGGLTLLFRQP